MEFSDGINYLSNVVGLFFHQIRGVCSELAWVRWRMGRCPYTGTFTMIGNMFSLNHFEPISLLGSHEWKQALHIFSLIWTWSLWNVSNTCRPESLAIWRHTWPVNSQFRGGGFINFSFTLWIFTQKQMRNNILALGIPWINILFKGAKAPPKHVNSTIQPIRTQAEKKTFRVFRKGCLRCPNAPWSGRFQHFPTWMA